MATNELPTPSDPRLDFYQTVTRESIPPNPVVSEASSDDELFDFFLLLAKDHGTFENEDDQVGHVEHQMETYKSSPQVIFRNGVVKEVVKKVYIIKDKAGRVVAGGAFVFLDPNNRSEVMLQSKVVHPAVRGLGLARLLTEARLREAGTDLAFCRVYYLNYEGLRSIFKEGFEMLVEPRPGEGEFVHGTKAPLWYLRKDLRNPHGNIPPPAHNLGQALRLNDSTGLINSWPQVKIPLEDHPTIQAALEAGYVGRWVFEENEKESAAKRQILYLEK